MKLYTSKPKEEIEYIAVSPSESKFVIRNPFSEKLKINGAKRDIGLFESEEGFTYLEYRSKRYLVEIIEKSQNKYTVLLNGVSYSFTIESPISYKRRKYLEKHKQADKTEAVAAPMPGKIVKIMVEVGDEVDVKHPMVIVEAMKMENQVNAKAAGTVKAVNFAAGDQVDTETPIIELDLPE